MKMILIGIILVLVGCTVEEPQPDNTNEVQIVNSPEEVAPHFDEVETLLTAVELAAGLGNYANAITYFTQLQDVLEQHAVTTIQQARIETMNGLLADKMVIAVMGEYSEDDEHEERIFTGSDAATKVMNHIGEVPGYTFVYHEIPSFVGSSGVGFYVFLVPDNHTELFEVTVRERFFVTSKGEILVLE